MTFRDALERSGNGSKLIVGLVRWFGGGAVLTAVGALVWVGMEVAESAQGDKRLEQKIDSFISEQRHINAQLYERLNRHDTRIRFLEQNNWPVHPGGNP